MSIRVIGVDIIGINKMFVSFNKKEIMIEIKTDTQKLKQKSQLNSLEISVGDFSIILSLIPNFVQSKITNDDAKAIYIKAESIVIKYIVDIIL